MATLLKPNGESVEVKPRYGKKFKLEELQKFVGGYIELVTLADRRQMFVNEDGKYKADLERNAAATKLFHEAGGMPNDQIVGNAIVCWKKEV